MESTSITISGAEFNVPLRFEEGHELTANEANALNQTFHENVRNNLAAKHKKGEPLDQSVVDKYAAEYQFGVRAAGATGITRDPVKAEAMRLAIAQIRDALKKKGRKAESDAIREKAKELIASDRGAPLMALAQKRVEEQRAAAAVALDDLIVDMPEKAPEATPAPTAPAQ